MSVEQGVSGDNLPNGAPRTGRKSSRQSILSVGGEEQSDSGTHGMEEHSPSVSMVMASLTRNTAELGMTLWDCYMILRRIWSLLKILAKMEQDRVK